MADQIKVTGVKETVAKLTKLGVSLGDLKDVMQGAGRIVADEARSLAPRRSGRLAASIRPSKAKNSAIVRAGSARVPYAGIHNYGGHGISGKFYLQKALQSKQGAAVDELEKGLGGLIRSAGP